MARVFAASILDELCQNSEVTEAEMLRLLRKQLNRRLSRQTFDAWRRGDQAVPTEILLVVAWIVGRRVSDAALEVALSVQSDSHADPAFKEMTRRYFSPRGPLFPP